MAAAEAVSAVVVAVSKTVALQCATVLVIAIQDLVVDAMEDMVAETVLEVVDLEMVISEVAAMISAVE